jgi:hypothetical protein
MEMAEKSAKTRRAARSIFKRNFGVVTTIDQLEIPYPFAGRVPVVVGRASSSYLSLGWGMGRNSSSAIPQRANALARLVTRLALWKQSRTLATSMMICKQTGEPP